AAREEQPHDANPLDALGGEHREDGVGDAGQHEEGGEHLKDAGLDLHRQLSFLVQLGRVVSFGLPVAVAEPSLLRRVSKGTVTTEPGTWQMACSASALVAFGLAWRKRM